MISRQELLEAICDAMDIESENVTEDTQLEELEEGWDSITRLSIIAIIDNYSAKVISPEALVESKTMKDLIDLAVAP